MTVGRWDGMITESFNTEIRAQNAQRDTEIRAQNAQRTREEHGLVRLFGTQSARESRRGIGHDRARLSRGEARTKKNLRFTLLS
jgi:hypothetical protein